MSHLNSQFFFNSQHHQTAPPANAFVTDLARDPSAAHQLIHLGISPRHDLPAVLRTDAAGKLRLVGLRLDTREAELLVGEGSYPIGNLVLYSATWCPDCRKIKQVLAEAGVDYQEVDLDTDATAEARVIERSGGRRVVPTLQFDQRLFAFNPDPSLVGQLIEPLGRSSSAASPASSATPSAAAANLPE